MEQYFNRESLSIIIASVSFLALLLIIFFVYKGLFKFFRNKISKLPLKFSVNVMDMFKYPALLLIFWALIELFAQIFLSKLSIYPALLHGCTLLLVFSISWIAIQFVSAGEFFLQGRLDIGASDNLHARKNLTQIKVFKAIANSIIVIISISVALLTFEQARTIGVSILTSAGVIGIIVGLAAQKTIAMILAGIQIAITQPIRLDDVVIVEGEWGRIEEITLTYVVVKIWDERRLVLPVTWFLEKPFQNWTRNSADITGSIFLYLDYSFPVDALRSFLPSIIKKDKNWDGRTMNVQVTRTSESYKEIRVLLSSSDASKNWNLRTAVREKTIDYINQNYPGSFVKIRIKNEADLSNLQYPEEPRQK